MPLASFGEQVVRVRSSDGKKFYSVTIVGGRPVACTCPSYEHRDSVLGTPGGCKHMRARVGKDAVGKTKCAECKAYLSPADEDYDAQMRAAGGKEIEAGQGILCMECWGSQQ